MHSFKNFSTVLTITSRIPKQHVTHYDQISVRWQPRVPPNIALGICNRS